MHRYIGRTGINGMSINCNNYMDCSETAFDVTLPQNAFASLYLPSLTSLSVADSRPSITTGACASKFRAEVHSDIGSSRLEMAVLAAHEQHSSMWIQGTAVCAYNWGPQLLAASVCVLDPAFCICTNKPQPAEPLKARPHNLWNACQTLTCMLPLTHGLPRVWPA